MITKDMSLLELMQLYPETRDYLLSRGMACARCMGAAAETVEDAAKQHGLDLDRLLDDLNKLLEVSK